MKLRYFGKVENGKLKITNRKGMLSDIERFEGKSVELTLSRRRNTRSNQQNAYMWGCVIPIVRQGLIDAGWEREKVNSAEVVHEILKDLFCPREEVVNENTGEVMRLPATTTNITTTQMMEYISDIQRWASEFLGVYIPEPNEQTKFEF